MKRFSEVVISGTALLLTFPLLLGGAVMVRLTSPGPVLYRAKRAGLGGKPFEMLKLRTMYPGTDSVNERVTAPGDNRITPVGRFLRKSRIDELPQFWNVLLGDMSIVGPRPEDWEIVNHHYTAEQRRLLQVRPGIVSPVDVHWYPDITYHDPPPPGIPMQEWYLARHLPVQISQGLEYVDHRSALTDVMVIARTVYCVMVSSWMPPRRRPLPVSQACPDRSGDIMSTGRTER